MNEDAYLDAYWEDRFDYPFYADEDFWHDEDYSDDFWHDEDYSDDDLPDWAL